MFAFEVKKTWIGPSPLAEILDAKTSSLPAPAHGRERFFGDHPMDFFDKIGLIGPASSSRILIGESSLCLPSDP